MLLVLFISLVSPPPEANLCPGAGTVKLSCQGDHYCALAPGLSKAMNEVSFERKKLGQDKLKYLGAEVKEPNCIGAFRY